MSREEEKELIWVEKRFAEKYNMLSEEANKNEERLRALNDYIETVSEKTRKDFKSDLECLEEDAAIYKGLMLSVRQAFEKAYDEHKTTSYAIWEAAEKEIPSIEKKVQEFVGKLKPLAVALREINELTKQLDTFNLDRFVDSIINITNLHGQQKEMMGFLIANFSKE